MSRLGFTVFCACLSLWRMSGADAISDTDAEFRKQLQLRLIQAQPGEIIEIPAGRWILNRSLSLNRSGVTLRGAGPDKTVLSFAAQTFGAEGLLINAASHVVIEGLAIEDAKGDGLKANGCKDLTVRNVRVEWTRGPDERNGAYGIYPVQSERVLIERSTAIGASEAGIYAGQSRSIVIRDSRVAFNVAGMEIENSSDVDVYRNDVTGNAGGILVFNVPDVPVKDGRRVRVFDNHIHANNTRNFAPRAGLIFAVPAGTGFMIMANSEVEVFDNRIEDNATTNALIVAFMATGKPQSDSRFHPYPQSLWIHHNRFSGGGDNPDAQNIRVLRLTDLAARGRLPDILWDGTTPHKDARDMHICIRDNGGATFMNFDWRGHLDAPSSDLTPHDCELRPLPAVGWPGLAGSAGT